MGLHFFFPRLITQLKLLYGISSQFIQLQEKTQFKNGFYFQEKKKKSLSYQIHIKKRGRNLWKLPEVPISDFTIAYRYQRKVLLLCNLVDSLA